MDLIEDIYSNSVYYPFLLYCQRRNYHTMRDLVGCRFDNLAATCPDITASLLMRIKMLFTAYCKKHPDLLMERSKQKPRVRAAAPKADPELPNRLREYFEAHPDTLIRAGEAAKALGVKRGDLLKALEQAPWCKAVDGATFFYVPVE